MCTYKSLKLIRILYAIACAIVVSNATAFVYGVQNQNYSSDRDYSSEIERRIRGGEITTADLIVDYHPRFWIRGLLFHRTNMP